MTSFALRRALPSLLGLLALLVGIGFFGVAYADFPVWLPFVLGAGFLLVQYAITPWLIERLIPAQPILHDGLAYATEHPIGTIVEQRCHDAGIPLVTLGVIDDGNPNAFTSATTGETPACGSRPACCSASTSASSTPS